MTLQELADQINEALAADPKLGKVDIVCQGDSEGNSFRHLAGLDAGLNWYEGEYNLEVMSQESFEDYGYDEEDKAKMTQCVVVAAINWPC